MKPGLEAICAAAARSGVQLWAEGAQLRFRAPAKGLGSELTAELRERRGELIAFLGRSRSAPATPAQARLWFLDRATPGSYAYNLATSVELRGRLDAVALERAIRDVVVRHEPLRTRFAELDGTIVQWIDAEPVEVLSSVVVRTWDEARRLADEESRQPFNLERGPLHRMILFTVSPTEHLLLQVVHHIVFDGWSGDIFKSELSEFYAAHAAGRTPSLPPPAMSYADHAATVVADSEDEESLEYWRRQLAGAPPLLEIPADRPRRTASDEGAVYSLTLDAKGAAALARRENTTLFAVFAAIFDVLLRCYVQRNDIVIGIPTAGRGSVETEGLIGMFVNTVALRCDLSGDPSFRELLARVTRANASAMAHEHVAFDRVVAELKPDRHAVHSPIFQVILNVDDVSADDIVRLGEASGRRRIAALTASRLDLGLSVEYRAAATKAMFVYRADHFDVETIARMGEHLRNVVKQVLEHPDRRLSELELMSGPERQQVVVGWNETGVDEPQVSLHALIAEQVERTPDDVAVVYGGQSISFVELDRRANRLAHLLRARGLTRNGVAAIFLDRTPDLVVSMLAVLKAGGAFLPLDRESPTDRITYILEASGASLVLTTSGSAFPAGGSRICVDRDTLESASGDAAPSDETQPDDLAYVLFTSGSTGRPKGVMVPHRSIVNHMRWMRAEFPLTSADTVLQRTAPTFDASVWEFYLPLLTGARLLLGSADAQRDPAEIIRTVARERVTVLQAVPTLLAEIAREPGASRLDSLRLVFAGGEALTSELSSQIARTTGAEVVNLYGPTEACIDASFHRCRPGHGALTEPIGKPIANTRLYVVNDLMQPLPVGIPGELLIAGAGLARGYIGRPDLTAERFVRDPFSADPEAHAYRTGDLVRRLRDGSIEFLGRIDEQVKIRGYRVECGEIEAVIRERLHVVAVVAARKTPAGDPALVAYYTTTDDQHVSPADMRRELSGALPAYMVPHAFVRLDALPHLPNGKVDRKALPETELTERPAGEFTEPRNETEAALASIWREVLNVSRVGVDDNFFHLGGHSLLAIRMVGRIRAYLGVDLPVRSVFEQPTLTELAARIAVTPVGALAAQPTFEEGTL